MLRREINSMINNNELADKIDRKLLICMNDIYAFMSVYGTPEQKSVLVLEDVVKELRELRVLLNESLYNNTLYFSI